MFGFAHSAMATTSVRKSIGLSDLNYRRLYNVQSLLLLLLLLIYGATIDSQYFLADNKANKAIGLMLATFGYLIIKLAFKQISLKSFLGFREEKQTELITTGIYARVRHPLYTATLLIVIGFVVFSPSYTNAIHAVCVTLYVFIGAYFEEKKLLKTYGSQYEDYRKRTPFILPKLFNK